MSRFLLDTNIISQATKVKPSQPLLDWLNARSNTELFISTLSLGEIWRGVLEKPKGQKRDSLLKWFSGPEGPQSLFRGRILPFDESAAMAWAEFMAAGVAKGRPRSAVDTMIAAIASTNDCTVVTDNEKHLDAVKVLNPLASID